MTQLSEREVVDHGAPLTQQQIDELKLQLNDAWEVRDHKLFRRFEAKNYAYARSLVAKIADLADSVNHHPDIKFSFRYVQVELYTHAIHGLAEADFIVAAKIDKLPQELC